MNWVTSNVFAPAGVSGPTLDHPAGDALAYAFPPEYPGWDSGDLTTMVGGAGWHMTAGELASVMGTFLTGRLPILGAQEAQAMLDNGFGVDLIASTKLGTLYAKPGGFVDSTDQVEQSVAFFLPQGFEVVVLVNSPVAPGDTRRRVPRAAPARPRPELLPQQHRPELLTDRLIREPYLQLAA